MNRFKEILDDFSQRAEAEKIVEESNDYHEIEEKEPALRLPYSSDPIPIEEAWK